MDDAPITSSKNPIVRRFREAAVGDPPEVMLVEGVKLLTECLAAELPIDEVAISNRLFTVPEGNDLRRKLERYAGATHEVSDGVMARLSSVKTPPGAAAIVRRPAVTRDALFELRETTSGRTPLLVVAAGVKDPGNLGALVRTAEAAGATGLWALSGGADPYREKAVRGSSGSVFRLPVLGDADPEDVVRECRERGLQIAIADSGGGRVHHKVDFRKPTALLLGAEAEGVPEPLRQAATVKVRIDMVANVESLNVAVAAGVLLFECRSQRRPGAAR